MIIPYIILVSLYIFLYIINDILIPKLLRCRLVKTYHTFSWVEGGVQLVDSLSGFCLDWQGRMPELKKNRGCAWGRVESKGKRRSRDFGTQNSGDILISLLEVNAFLVVQSQRTNWVLLTVMCTLEYPPFGQIPGLQQIAAAFMNPDFQAEMLPRGPHILSS